MDKDQLWNEISGMIKELEKRGEHDTLFHFTWNLLTDIVTNDIRDECIEDAVHLRNMLRDYLKDTK